MSSDPSSAEITRKAKSNLAFALKCVPAERREHLVSFYAFCRVIDDLADDLDLPLEEKIKGLAGWHAIFEKDTVNPDLGLVGLQDEILKVRDTYEIPPEYFTNVIEGCQMDLQPQRFETWENLQEYTYRVASSVGLVCLPLFAADSKRSHDYAVALGHALQLTNILRDINEDLSNGGRIYVPIQDLGRFHYSEKELIEKVYDDRFLAFMTAQADRCEALYAKATKLLPPEDHKALLAPRVMHRIYHTLLQKMREDKFRVFDRRYSLGKLQKISLLVKERFAWSLPVR